jgi:aryl-alcohol dehydrogenase-like predicted oxidoreductase
MDWKKAVLGRTGRSVGRLGLAASYGADQRCVEMAVERGVNYLYWGSMRLDSFGAGLKALRPRRDQFMVVIQSYTRLAALLPWSLERALRKLEMDYADVLLLGMWNKDVSPAVFERACKLRERGLVRHVAVSTHNRRQAVEFAANKDVDILHVRYNAVHPGAERDIFPHLAAREQRPGIVSFTATSWGQLLQTKNVPAGDAVPTAGDAYRFVLSNPSVDVAMTGPKNAAQLTEALDAWEKGPMSPEEMAWMRRVGDSKYAGRGVLAWR